ncbi:hypothetical protein [Neorhizobium galegae]|uniref:hypothetical protein n=1 Tax=Neorhizobium galegae TaxID=399 RepID=UPI0006276A89|nr:hypothetical protein [Neorhizobium galegae]KAA9385861.1 hypothetical protein F4V88_04970 [Neorhizobium galegae]KAB1113713.1 hypothetical protein F4V89_13475 [Neorhizobium galegae]MCM2496674.1 hypothetical protein [Neorhizobium galegae]MCQ1764038.1 hypothetical protein [Neorhizobium galegae]MCQ1770173.1 hypothetical protein [Neorhizobium galegae]
MTTIDELVALQDIPEIDAILRRASALSLCDSVYEIFRSRYTLAHHERKAGISNPQPYVFRESSLFCWIKIANPEATDGEIIDGYELIDRLQRAYGDCTEVITHQVGTQVPIPTRASMVVQLLQSRFPMFSEKTLEKFSWDWLIANR